jgi:hypothetical protein
MKTISFLAGLMFVSIMAFAAPRQPMYHPHNVHGHRDYRHVHHQVNHRHYGHRYGHHRKHGRPVHHPHHHAGMHHRA